MGQTENLSKEIERKLKHYRLSRDEYKRMVGLLGREPFPIEWPLFSALWSEHCSYKSSKVHLKNLFSKGERVLESFGENAGVIDLGYGERIAFKMESHNHPSFIEPYQGAATGVGGILRDIFTMGARPIALANYLCFGEPSAPRMRSIVDGVIRGIAGYGNSVGVPMVTGQTEFDSAYNQNVLVNAMAVGLFGPADKVFVSRNSSPGHLVVYAGSRTGRDGVHGASMASESFDKDSQSKRPTVQIGDPFYEKLLIEACLEVMKRDLVVAIQDMGAAGLTSSSFEMSAKGGVGFRIHLDKVPLRDASLTAEDILLSESQERMLMVVRPENLDPLIEVFTRWGLEACAIGEVLQSREVELYMNGELLTRIDPELLVEHAPRYQRPFQPHKPVNRVSELTQELSERWIAAGEDGYKAGCANIVREIGKIQGGSRLPVFEQFDQHVGANTVSGCDEQVGIVCLPDSKRPLGVSLGCRPQIMKMDAMLGGIDSIMRPALSLSIKGLEPLAVTDCLNFANPERVAVMSDFVTSLEGLNLACEALKTPIISGNVSLYNETEGKGIIPTPSTGLVGLGVNVDGLPQSSFQRAGSHISIMSCDLVRTDLQRFLLERDWKSAVEIWTNWSRSLVELVRTLQRNRLICSTRLVGKGGVLSALVRMALPNQIGLSVAHSGPVFESQFGRWMPHIEPFYAVILETGCDDKALLEYWSGDSQFSKLTPLGLTGGGSISFGEQTHSLADLQDIYEGAWKQVQ